jgi:hypothetical protein
MCITLLSFSIADMICSEDQSRFVGFNTPRWRAATGTDEKRQLHIVSGKFFGELLVG